MRVGEGAEGPWRRAPFFAESWRRRTAISECARSQVRFEAVSTTIRFDSPQDREHEISSIQLSYRAALINENELTNKNFSTIHSIQSINFEEKPSLPLSREIEIDFIQVNR